jgi:prepilin-type N-terminal cleavage/methylation domain-containing protein
MRNEAGFTLLEMLVVLGITTILSGMAVVNLRKFDYASSNAANQIASLIKSARAYGITSTTTVEIKPLNSRTIRVSKASSCSTTPRTDIPELLLELPTSATLSSTTWALCYTSRGISHDSIDILITDNSKPRTVQVVLGGGIRVL